MQPSAGLPAGQTSTHGVPDAAAAAAAAVVVVVATPAAVVVVTATAVVAVAVLAVVVGQSFFEKVDCYLTLNFELFIFVNYSFIFLF